MERNRKDRNGGVLDTVAELFDLPADLVAGLPHLEMVGTIVYQLTRNMTPEQIKAAGFDDYFVDHTAGVYPVAASGTPFNAATFSVTGDTIADLHEDMSADGAFA